MPTTAHRPASPSALAARSVPISVDSAGAAPTAMRVIPAGEFRSWDGRPSEVPSWKLDAALAAPIIAAAAARASDYVIDYEHQTIRAAENGRPAPAAGWYKTLEWRDDGLYATDVRWTANAARMIADREYRYVSPVFAYDKKTGEVQSLAHVGLVANPGLDGLTDLAVLAGRFFSSSQSPEIDMPEILKKLLAALGLQETATETEALGAIAGLKSHLAALSAQVTQPDPAKFVPVAVLTALQGEHATQQARLSALAAQVSGAQLDKVVTDGLAAGKLTPATEPWARELGKKDLAALSSFLSAAPVVISIGDTQTGGKGGAGQAGASGLTETELKVCAAMAISPEAFAKTKLVAA